MSRMKTDTSLVWNRFSMPLTEQSVSRMEAITPGIYGHHLHQPHTAAHSLTGRYQHHPQRHHAAQPHHYSHHQHQRGQEERRHHPSHHQRHPHHPHHQHHHQQVVPHHQHQHHQDRYAPIKRLAMVQVQPPRNPNKPLTAFSISDILNGRVGGIPQGPEASLRALGGRPPAEGPGLRDSPPTPTRGATKVRSRPRSGETLASPPATPQDAVGQLYGLAAVAGGPSGLSLRLPLVAPAAGLPRRLPHAARPGERGSPVGAGGGGPKAGLLQAAIPRPASFVRPWDDIRSPGGSSGTGDDRDADGEEDDENDVMGHVGDDDDEEEEEEIEIEDVKPPKKKSQSPLDALLQMTSKTFDGGSGPDGVTDEAARRDQLSIFSKSQPAKKRRKSRTAFTNQQIYELEKRFLYQKYLTPADRDEIAQSLGLSNAQVITWFQNRRAKLKRDLEELKADVTAASSLSPNPDTPLGSLDDLSLTPRPSPINGRLSADESDDSAATPKPCDILADSATSPPGDIRNHDVTPVDDVQADEAAMTSPALDGEQRRGSRLKNIPEEDESLPVSAHDHVAMDCGAPLPAAGVSPTHATDGAEVVAMDTSPGSHRDAPSSGDE